MGFVWPAYVLGHIPRSKLVLVKLSFFQYLLFFSLRPGSWGVQNPGLTLMYVVILISFLFSLIVYRRSDTVSSSTQWTNLNRF